EIAERLDMVRVERQRALEGRARARGVALAERQLAELRVCEEVALVEAQCVLEQRARVLPYRDLLAREDGEYAGETGADGGQDPEVSGAEPQHGSRRQQDQADRGQIRVAV